MTTVAWFWLVGAALAAAADWFAVATERRRLEYVAKPAVLVGLIGLAAWLVPGSPGTTAAVPWFIAALILSLVGDVLLMLPRERFVGGLIAFLLAHLAYIGGFAVSIVIDGLAVGGLVVGLLVIAVVIGWIGRPIIGAVRVDRPRLLWPVLAYLVVISVLVIVACASGRPFALAGAALFYASDAILATDRFVRPRRWARLATHVTYHAGQALLVLSLLG